MTFSQKTILHACIFTFIGVSIGYIGNEYDIYGMTKSVDSGSLGVSQSGVLQFSNNEIFATKKVKKTMDIIRKNSYGFDKKTTEQIEDAVLGSIVKGLGDKHSTYFTKKETESFEESLRGDFEGIGAVINEHPLGIKVMKIIPGSPAEKSGLLAGDILTKVGNQSIVGKTTEEAVKVIRGPKGTQADITYRRGNENKDRFVRVTRDTVSVPSVSSKMLEKSIGHIEVSTFGEHTTREFITAWNQLTLSGAKGMILDFRNNGGGYLETAIDLTSIVLPKDSTVVIIKQNAPKKNEVLKTRIGAKSNTTLPIIVLINDYSASASEIFAGAIQDYGRGLLLGEKSYGKGSVQEPFDLGDGSIIKITTARWYTPKDTSIDEKGITPDIAVTLTNKDYEEVFDRQLRAAELILQDQISTNKSQDVLKHTYTSYDFTSLKK